MVIKLGHNITDQNPKARQSDHPIEFLTHFTFDSVFITYIAS